MLGKRCYLKIPSPHSDCRVIFPSINNPFFLVFLFLQPTKKLTFEVTIQSIDSSAWFFSDVNFNDEECCIKYLYIYKKEHLTQKCLILHFYGRDHCRPRGHTSGSDPSVLEPSSPHSQFCCATQSPLCITRRCKGRSEISSNLFQQQLGLL